MQLQWYSFILYFPFLELIFGYTLQILTHHCLLIYPLLLSLSLVHYCKTEMSPLGHNVRSMLSESRIFLVLDVHFINIIASNSIYVSWSCISPLLVYLQMSSFIPSFLLHDLTYLSSSQCDGCVKKHMWSHNIQKLSLGPCNTFGLKCIQSPKSYNSYCISACISQLLTYENTNVTKPNRIQTRSPTKTVKADDNKSIYKYQFFVLWSSIRCKISSLLRCSILDKQRAILSVIS